MFENKNYEGIYYSRFIASWANEGGSFKRGAFKEWLRTLKINGKEIPEDIIREINELATNGKMELETLAREFIKKED